MTIEHYRKALESAIAEFEALGEQRRAIDKRLSEISESINSLSRLCGLTPNVSMGLTDGCRLVLRNGGLPMTPIEIRDRLAAFGFDMAKYANDLSAIHTVLKRLNHAGEIRFAIRAPGKPTYVWNHQFTAPTTIAAHGSDLKHFINAVMSPAAVAPATTSKRRKATK
ncbi:MAG: hypothetical protein HY047_06525 [Acidobacteria bacterium]|nr:hypothetical protein [Acidobacteriota bacterium]